MQSASASTATPNPVGVDVVDQVKSALKEFTELHGIQSAFNAFMVHDANVAQDLLNSMYKRIAKTLKDSSSNQESLEVGIKHVISVAGGHTNEESVEIMLNVLEKLVSNNVVTARLVCESLLDSDKMVYKNSKFWIQSFILIKKIISGVDYKGVREIMKTCLEKVNTFPDHVASCYLPQLNAIVRLLQHIFDRTTCLLPAYFIVNEILKNHPDNRPRPHWSISQLVSELVESFKSTAQIVSIIGRTQLFPVVDHCGHGGYMMVSWKLDPVTLRHVLKGNLPYDQELLRPQNQLLHYVLQQPYSRDMVCAILGLQKQHKQRCVALEQKMVEIILMAMERTELEVGQNLESQSETEQIPSTLPLWQHISTQLIFFVLFQFASFPHLVSYLHQKISDAKFTWTSSRDFLCWVLLQFISGSIQKNPLNDFLPVLRLYDLLYPEREPLPLPDMSKPVATAQMSATCIWIHILRKAQSENQQLPRPLPPALKDQFEFLQNLVSPNGSHVALQANDFRVALLCNAFSTNQDYFSRPMASLVEFIHGSTTSGSGSPTSSTPLSVEILDSLTIHTKMSLIHNIVTHIVKVAQSKMNPNLSHALIETYARLLVYTEIESLGIKGFISQLLPTVYKSQAWGILHTLLEMFCYRLHHIQSHYRIQLLTHLHSLAANTHTSSAQLHLCVEMTSLRLIAGLSNMDIQTQLPRVIGEPKVLVSADSEELNRALVLTIARAIHVAGNDWVANGTWFRDILNAIMQNTPMSWSPHTLQCFPPALAEYFQQNPVPKENKQQLKQMVDEQYRNWTAMLNNEHELIEHFSMQGTPALFLCIVWKMLMETGQIDPLALKVIEKIGPKGLSIHLRKFCDYLICEFCANRGNTPENSAQSQRVIMKIVDTAMDMVWKYNLVPFDRFILCMALRRNEGSDAQMGYFLMHLLMFKNQEFRNRVTEFVANNSPEHWKQTNWHEKHTNYHSKFPEVFLFEDQQQNQLPIYFGNVCLRFLPVLDILIHRFLEINSEKSIDMTLQSLGGLYKFHDHPITYLYNTCHYYESRLRDKPSQKRRLVSFILGSLKDVNLLNVALTDDYINYISSQGEATWSPDQGYYANLVARFVEVIQGKTRLFAGIDWRYNEFPNAVAHALTCTALEILALPVQPNVAGSSLLDAAMHGRALMKSKDSSVEDLETWMNATGLVLIALPEPYWTMLHDRLVTTLEGLEQPWIHRASPLTLFDFKTTYNKSMFAEYSNLLAVTHAVWHHLGNGNLHHIQTLVTERFLPIVKNEIQLLFVCHLIAPFLQRFNSDKPTMVCRLTIALYELLEKVDKNVPTDSSLQFMDVFCDLLYHIKYMFTGDIVKNEIEMKIRCLRPALQLRLRFITHLNIENIATQAAGTTQQQQHSTVQSQQPGNSSNSTMMEVC